MTAKVTNQNYGANFTDISRMKREYNVKLKREVFKKLFSGLKMTGHAIARISDEREIELDYTLDKSPHVTILTYSPCRGDKF